MKLCLGLVVAAAVCMEMAQGLSCYTCDNTATSSECNQKTNCTALSSKLAYCKTTIMSPEVGFPFTGKEVVFRQCVEQCVPTSQGWLGVTRKIFCCNLDYCNRNGIQQGSTSITPATTTEDCSKNTGAMAAVNLITTIVLLLSAVIYSIQ